MRNSIDLTAQEFEMLAFLATFACGSFFGAAVYVSLAQIPASLELGGELAGRFFAPMYRRAARVQAPLAVVGTATAILSWLAGAGPAWLVGGLLLFAVLPLTYIRIMPINNQLLDPNRALSASETEDLLQRWGHLHAIRTALSGIAFLIFLAGLARS